MLWENKTYPAILHGDRLEWTGERPPFDLSRPTLVRITLADSPPEESETERRERGERMVEALRKLAERGTFAGITDPVAWQREIREDRALPGRPNVDDDAP